MKLAVVTNVCTHYRKPLFESVAERFEADFYFTSRGREWYQPSYSRVDAGDHLHAVPEGRALRLGRALVRGKYDCIVASLVGRTTLLATVAAARLTGRPLVLWVGIWSHPTTTFHRLSRRMARTLYRKADSLIVYGPHVAAHVAAESGRTEKIFEVSQAVDNELFRRSADGSDVEKVRATFGPGNSPVGCFVGRLEREKGLEMLLQALSMTVIDQRLMLVGSGSLEPELRSFAASLGVAEKIIFAGRVSQNRLPAYLQAADFLVLPSVTTNGSKETWGHVVNEAMNSGLPVIATDAVGAAAGGLVVNGETGCVIAERDTTALAGALDELASNEATRRHMGARGAAHVLMWNFDRAADTFERAILTAVDQKGSNIACTPRS